MKRNVMGMEKYMALVLKNEENVFTAGYELMEKKPLEKGEVRVAVRYSSVNFKDRLTFDPKTKVVRSYPMVPGIDFSGVVEESNDAGFQVGDKVFLTGHGYGTDRPGGYRASCEVQAEHLQKIPEGLSLRDTMVYGTAGITAALSVHALVQQGLSREGSVLVTGGTGGVASHAILILKKLGYHVTAATRKPENEAYLKGLGADEIILYEDLMEKRPLARERWSGAVDAAGGAAVGGILSELRYGGAVAVSGNMSGIRFEGSVFPLILRGVAILGIDSVYASMERRNEIAKLLAEEWYSEKAALLVREEISFLDLHARMMNPSKGTGRDIVVFE